MAETSNSINKPANSNDPSFSEAHDSSDTNFWYNMFTSSQDEEQQEQQLYPGTQDEQQQLYTSSQDQQQQQLGWPSRLHCEWDHVLDKVCNSKKRKKMDVGSSSSAVKSSSDLPKALSSLSAALSLSSSASSHSSSREELEAESLFNVSGHQILQDENMDNSIESLSSFDVHSLSSESGGDDMFALHNYGDELEVKSTCYTSGETRKDNFQVPELGMVFSSDEEAYNFYKNYAKETGFGVRKGKVQRLSDGTIRKRLFFCSCQGLRSEKQSEKKTKYKRKETRTGCNAKIQCTVEDGKWVISQVSDEHNHQLKNQSHMRQSGTKTSEAYSLLHKKSGCEKAKDDDSKTNCSQPQDVQSLMNYLRQLQVKDPSFFYAIQLNASGRVSNFFWRDGGSRIDYENFSDVLILDTTLRVDKYGMIYAPFIGLNHHRQYVFFGCALLLDQSSDSYIWLLQTFMEAMGRNQPKTIFTDEGVAMADAIKLVMPETQHRLGVWFIQQNALKQLSTCYRQPGFQSCFNKCILDCLTEEEFETKWDYLLDQFNLLENPWLRSLYKSRERWADIYSKKTFCAGIRLGPRIKHMFQSLRQRSISLTMSVQKYLKVVERQRRKEQYEDFHFNKSELVYSRGIENHAMKVYTSTIFSAFQKEMLECLFLKIEEISRHGTVATFKLTHESHTKERIVEFNYVDTSVSCSCKKFESDGLLCAHALKVLSAADIPYIPSQFILKRWTRSAKSSGVANFNGQNVAEKRQQPLSLYDSRLKHKPLNVMTDVVAAKEGLDTIADHIHTGKLEHNKQGLAEAKKMNLHPCEEVQCQHIMPQWKGWCETLRQENRRLQMELQRALKTCQSFKMQLHITSAPSPIVPRPTQSSLSLPPLPPSPSTINSMGCPSSHGPSRSSPSCFMTH